MTPDQHHDTVSGFFAFVAGLGFMNFMAWLANAKDSLQGLLALVSILVLLTKLALDLWRPSNKRPKGRT
jgi:hypothetical protein